MWGVGPERGLGSGVLRSSRLSIPDHSREMPWWGLRVCHVKDGLSHDQGARRPQTLPLPFHAARTPERGAEGLGPAAPWGRGQCEPAPLSRGPRSPRSQPLGHAVAPKPTVGALSPARPGGYVT